MLPSIELEFFDAGPQEVHAADDNQAKEDEFDFPLFSFGMASKVPDDPQNEDASNDNDEPRGRDSTTKLMKVTLRSPSPEVINNQRPRTYYFAEYSAQELMRFQSAAIQYDQIITEASKDAACSRSLHRRRIFDLKYHNDKIEAEIQRALKNKKRRPGKKQRLARKQGTIRNAEREAQAKEIKKMIKKKFHKRGGKKNKKKDSVAADVKPKFRTE